MDMFTGVLIFYFFSLFLVVVVVVVVGEGGRGWFEISCGVTRFVFVCISSTSPAELMWRRAQSKSGGQFMRQTLKSF